MSRRFRIQGIATGLKLLLQAKLFRYFLIIATFRAEFSFKNKQRDVCC